MGFSAGDDHLKEQEDRVLDARTKLEEDRKFPSVRALSLKLGWGHNTVHRAIVRMQEQGRWPESRISPPLRSITVDQEDGRGNVPIADLDERITAIQQTWPDWRWRLAIPRVEIPRGRVYRSASVVPDQ